MNDFIEIRGAREHNLRDIQLKLPKNQLVVLTGVSGSGKSSLAFDTLYAEGQRRYIESLSSYARQFMGQMRKPDVDYLAGLSPSISIEQKTGGSNPRSTVGTITEIHDYLRVLYARVGSGFCPQCGDPIEAQSREQILGRVLAESSESPSLILSPVVQDQKGEFKDFFAEMARRGYVRARVDGELHRLTEELHLDRQMKHRIDIVIDRVSIVPKNRGRIAEAIESALELSEGMVVVVTGDEETRLSANYACARCGLSFAPPSPQLFSFNSPQGMCPGCDGLGRIHTFDPELLIPDPSKSIQQGAIALVGTFRGMGRWRRHLWEGLAETMEFSLATPWEELPESIQYAVLHGAGDRHITYAWRTRGKTHLHGGSWEGLVPQYLSKYRKTNSPMHRAMFEKYMRVLDCERCGGDRLNEQARSVRVAGRSLIDVERMPVSDAQAFFASDVPKSLGEVEQTIASELIKEIRGRLGFLENVGLGYLALDRPAPTLSGGEAQRIRLASQIGSGLVGVLYVLDEPSIGLHPRDNARLLETLKRLRDQGNTVVVVEHDEDTIRAADHVVDFGPGPGVRGGEVVAEGTLRDVLKQERSLTGRYLSGKEKIPIPTSRRPVDLSTRPNPKKSPRKKTRAKSSKG
ncbi:UvrABC system protein A [Planctomycetes bacterium Pan216]|uniref:UvrABC system protein A n=1 Tax=Kolteria novifilia TaxID=2527975 RepID=A0A518B5Q9_9BACT|nr:UvrABC system protein A [Planctomycetes bacterium Pan216]